MEKTKSNRWWKVKYTLFGQIPQVCPYCGGEVIERGFKGHNRRVECKKCNQTLID